MRITILANKDLASNYAINLLLPHLTKHKVSLFLSAKVGGNTKKPKELNRLKFFEQDLFNLSISVNLPLPKDRKSNARSFAQIDEILSHPHRELNDINSKKGIELIQQIEPDLIISIRFGVILKDQIINIPKHGVINLHSGLLPEYRGVMATFWAMLNQEKVIGTTLHYIDDASIDTGRVIARTNLKVDKTKSYLWHVLQLYNDGIQNISSTICRIESNLPIEIRNQCNAGSYFSFPSEEELKYFHEQELELVDEQDYMEFIQNNYY
jgi:methionyl-tRNA formyltransferase